MSERINRLTAIMLILTWITLIISIPNTFATFFGIPKISDALRIEMIITSILLSLILPLTFLFWVGFDLKKIMKDKKINWGS
jgi:hypothetical protein